METTYNVLKIIFSNDKETQGRVIDSYGEYILENSGNHSDGKNL